MGLFLFFILWAVTPSLLTENPPNHNERIEGSLETLLGDQELIEVIGDLTPFTLYIPKIVLRESLGKDFKRWICNPDVEHSCMTNRNSIPDNQLDDIKIAEEADFSRRKRFVGALIAGILGIGGLIDAEYTRHRLNSEVARLDLDIMSLKTGLHDLGTEVLAHVRLDQKWRDDMGYYVHNQFSQQRAFNARVVQDIQNLYRAFNEEWNTLRQRLEDTRRRIINLAKLTSMSITRLADEISMINSLLDAMLWQSILEGRFPRWALDVPAIRTAFLNVSRKLPGYDSDDGWPIFVELVSTRKWTILHSNNNGTLIGMLIPARENIGILTSVKVPLYCARGDDGIMYGITLKEKAVKVVYQGETFFLGDNYLAACERWGKTVTCVNPNEFPVRRNSRVCSAGIFLHQEVDGCEVIMTECKAGHSLHRTQRTLMVSGDIVLKVGGKEKYHGSDVIFLVPLVLKETMLFTSPAGKVLATIHKSLSEVLITPTAISFTGDWKFPPDEPWNGGSTIPSLLKIPDLEEPPKLDEGELMVQIKDTIRKPGLELQMHSSLLQSSGSSSSTWMIGVFVTLGIVFLLIFGLWCFSKYFLKRRNVGPTGLVV